MTHDGLSPILKVCIPSHRFKPNSLPANPYLERYFRYQINRLKSFLKALTILLIYNKQPTIIYGNLIIIELTLKTKNI